MKTPSDLDMPIKISGFLGGVTQKDQTVDPHSGGSDSGASSLRMALSELTQAVCFLVLVVQDPNFVTVLSAWPGTF